MENNLIFARFSVLLSNDFQRECYRMKKKRFGIVIKVKNLTSCKAFYRDVLGLGDPVLDSNFRVEFQFGDTFCLTLEKSPFDAVLPPASGRIAWLFDADAETIRRRLNVYGYAVPNLPDTEKKGETFCRFSDPEGNPFYVISGKKQ